MNTLSLSLGLSLIFATTLITPVVAQTSDSKPQLPSETGSADDLRVSPRGGVGFSTTGSGYEDPFFSLEGFIPLQQSPGSTLTFLEGKLLISTDSTMGGNILLGKRFYSPSQDQILGGYIAYDFRDTGNSFFNQISAGFERLSKNWDLRINGYLPVGNRRQQVAESFSNPTFQENSLLLDRNRQFESAVAGVDLEVGTQLLPLGDGDLRGYAGVYYYNAQGGNDGFGIRGRLEARPSDNLRVGLLVQNDPLFDTRVVLSLGASFPGTRPRGAQRDSTLARIGESVGRTSTITVDEQKELETITATNPTTNEAYRFQHVNLGMGNSDGTFESPFATVQEALAVAQPNDIVYVQAAIDPGIPSFKIPDNVSVLSSGPVQLIDTVEARNVQLPFSGTGLLPTITDTVVLGNNTVLSGFKFLNPAGNAIEGTNVSNLTIRNNQITGAAQSGISLSNVTGTTTLANNSITNSGAGISLNNNIGSVDLNVNGNSLTNNLEHITVGLVDTAVGTVGIVENIVTGGSVGVGVEAGGNSLLDVNIGSNTVNNTTQTGIAVDILGQAQVNATINDNSLTNNLENIAVGLVDTVVGTVGIVENTVIGGGVGVGVEAGGNSLLDVNIGSNTVNNTTQTGIAVDILGQAQVNATINDNSLTNNLENIAVGLVDTAVGTVGIVENTVTGGGVGVGVEAGGNSLLDVNIGSNTVSNTTQTGIAVDILGQAQVNATINDNSLTNNLENIAVGLVDTAVGTVGIVENEITGGGLGINVDVAGNSVLSGSIGNNNVSNTSQTGIAVDALQQGQLANVTVSGNTLTNNTENIAVGLVDTAVGTVNIVENEVTGGGLGINVDVAGNAVLTANIGNNTVNNTSETGIAVDALGQAQVNATINDNSLTNNVENIGVSLTDTAVGTVGIVENEITGGGLGINVDVAGNSVLSGNIGNNNVSNTSQTGIAVDALQQGQLANVTVSGNTLTNNTENIAVGLTDTATGTVGIVGNEVTGGGVGISVEAAGNSVLTGNIGNNSVENTSQTGIAIDALQQGQLANVTINDNSLTNNTENISVGLVDTATGTVGIVGNEVTGGGVGISVEAAGNSVLTGNIGNNSVENTSQTGIAIDALQQGQLANVTVNDNSLTNNTENIGVSLTDTGSGTVGIVGNEVIGGGVGISVEAAGNSVLNTSIGSNTVQNTTGTGIDVSTLDQTQVSATINNNSLENNVNGVNVDSTGAAQGMLAIVNNQVTNNLSGVTIGVALADNSVLQVGIASNSVDTPSGTGIIIDAPQATNLTLTVDQDTTANLQLNVVGEPVFNVTTGGILPPSPPPLPLPTTPISVPSVPTTPISVPEVPTTPISVPEVPTTPISVPEVPTTPISVPEVPTTPISVPEVPTTPISVPEVPTTPISVPEVPTTPISVPEVPTTPISVPEVPTTPISVPEVPATPISVPSVPATPISVPSVPTTPIPLL